MEEKIVSPVPPSGYPWGWKWALESLWPKANTFSFNLGSQLQQSSPQQHTKRGSIEKRQKLRYKNRDGKNEWKWTDIWWPLVDTHKYRNKQIRQWRWTSYSPVCTLESLSLVCNDSVKYFAAFLSNENIKNLFFYNAGSQQWSFCWKTNHLCVIRSWRLMWALADGRGSEVGVREIRPDNVRGRRRRAALQRHRGAISG